MTVGAALSSLGTKSNTVLAGQRYIYALAKDGCGPTFPSRVHPQYNAPAIVLQTAIACCWRSPDCRRRDLPLAPKRQAT